MGVSLEQILAEGADGATVGVTIVTNQDNGIASYAVGALIYHVGVAAEFKPGGVAHSKPASLETAVPLAFYFSDRLGPPVNQGGGIHLVTQPFSANNIDELGVSITFGVGHLHIAKFTFISWGGSVASIPLESRGNLLFGLGPPLGNSPNALYVIAFNSITPPTR